MILMCLAAICQRMKAHYTVTGQVDLKYLRHFAILAFTLTIFNAPFPSQPNIFVYFIWAAPRFRFLNTQVQHSGAVQKLGQKGGTLSVVGSSVHQ